MATKAIVKERPIIFSGPMARAILGDRKTQTRRVMKPQPCESFSEDHSADGQPTKRRSYGYTWEPRRDGAFFNVAHTPILDACPYGKPGDRLWGRETWAIVTPKWDGPPVICIYRATPLSGPGIKTKWRPSIHMPRRYARLILEIVTVRVERLQEITEADAAAEGAMEPIRERDGRAYDNAAKACAKATRKVDPDAGVVTARGAFAALWDTINAERGFSWASNPWVWAIDFKRIPRIEKRRR